MRRTYPHLVLLLLVVSCYHPQSPAERERLYKTAVAIARTRSAYPMVGPGLRLGIRKAQVEQHLDSLRRHGGLFWHLRTGYLPMQVYSDFADDRLIRLAVVLPGPGLTNTPEYQELVRSLDQTYGTSYYHGLEGGLRSWFAGATEVQFIATQGFGYCFSYIDVHRVTDYNGLAFSYR